MPYIVYPVPGFDFNVRYKDVFQAFDVPTSDKIKDRTVLAGEKTVIATNALQKTLETIVSVQPSIVSNSLQKSIEIIKSDGIMALTTSSIITKISLPSTRNMVFNTPGISKLNYNNKLVADTAKIDIARVRSGLVLKGLSTEILSMAMTNFKPPIISYVFNTPTANSLLKPIEIIRSDKTILGFSGGRHSLIVKSSTIEPTISIVNKFKTPITKSFVFDTPIMNPVKASTVLRGTAALPILNTVTNIFSQTSVVTILSPINARENLYYSQLAKGRYGVTIPYKFPMGDIPLTSTVGASSTTTFFAQSLVSTTKAPINARENLYYNNLASGFRADKYQNRYNSPATTSLQAFYAPTISAISKLKLPSTNSMVFGTPAVDKLKVSFVVSSDKTTLTSGKLKTNYKVADDKITFSTDKVKYIPGIRETSGASLSLVGVSSTTTFFAQSLVSTTKAPTNARENLYYAQLAKGRYGVIIPYKPTMADAPFNSVVGASSTTTFFAQSLVSTILAPTNARENLYYAQLAKGRYGVTIPLKFTIADAPFTAVVGASSTTTFFAQSLVSTTKAPTNARENLYYINISPAIREDRYQNKTNAFTNNVAQIFNTPLISNLRKSIEVIKSDITILSSGKLKDSFVIKDPSVNISTLKIDKIKLPAVRAQVFDAPISNNIKISTVLKGFSNIINTEKLAVFNLTPNPGDFLVAVTGQSSDSTNSTIDFYLEYSPSSDMLSVTPVVSPIKTLYFNFTNSTLIFEIGSTVKIIDTNTTNIYFVTVTASTANSISFVKPSWTVSSSGAFIESTYSTVYSKDYVQPVTLSSGIPRENLFSFGVSPAIKSDRYQKISSFSNRTHVFNSPTSSSLQKSIEVIRADKSVVLASSLQKSIEIIKSDPTKFLVNKLSASFVIRDASVAIVQASINKFKTPFTSTNVFDTPVSNKLNFSIKVMADRSSISVNALQKRLEVIKDVPAVSLVASNTAVYLQNAVTTINAPVIPRENLYYAILAKGKYGVSFPYNIVADVQNKFADVNKLSQFSPDIYPGDFKFEVIGQSADSTSTIVSYYLEYDVNSDLLFTTPVISSTKTLYFNNTFVVPFEVGSNIKISNLNSGDVRFVTVLSSTKNSVTFAKPSWSVDVTGLFVESGFTVYSQYNVSTDVAPINSRENFYYLNLAPFIRSDRWQHFSDVLHTQPYDISPIDGLGNMQQSYESVRDPTDVADLLLSADRRLGKITVFRVDMGLADPTFKKKDPIQFWN